MAGMFPASCGNTAGLAGNGMGFFARMESVRGEGKTVRIQRFRLTGPA
jgi:hypothetical protein